jgi:protein HIRA/HIR1
VASASALNSANGSNHQSVPDDVLFEAKNPNPVGHIASRDPTRITVTRKGQTLWQDFLPKSVLLVTGNQNFWAAACEEGSIYVWTPAGRRSLNPLVLEAQAVIIECRDWWLLCITAVGMCHVWSLKTLSSPHPPVSVAPVLDIAFTTMSQHPTVAPAVTSAQLNSGGHIIITLSNGEGFTYSPLMYAWQRLSESWFAVGSQYWNSNDSSVGSLQQAEQTGNDAVRERDAGAVALSSGIIPFLERHTTNEFLLRGRAYSLQRLIKALLAREGFEGFESAVSIAHLENRIAAALQLGAKEEFRLYLFMYAKRLGAEGMRGKVDELLRSLLGGMFKEAQDVDDQSKDSGRGWQTDGEDICGWKRRELLKGVVLILGTTP